VPCGRIVHSLAKHSLVLHKMKMTNDKGDKGMMIITIPIAVAMQRSLSLWKHPFYSLIIIQ